VSKVPFKYRPPPGVVPGSERAPEPPPAEILPEPIDPKTKVDRWWYESSWDLRRGLDVVDEDTTIPGELLDEFPPPPPPKPKR
jgi:hypothetical protein